MGRLSPPSRATSTAREAPQSEQPDGDPRASTGSSHGTSTRRLPAGVPGRGHGVPTAGVAATPRGPAATARRAAVLAPRHRRPADDCMLRIRSLNIAISAGSGPRHRRPRGTWKWNQFHMDEAAVTNRAALRRSGTGILVMLCIARIRPIYGPFYERESRKPSDSRQNRDEFSRRTRDRVRAHQAQEKRRERLAPKPRSRSGYSINTRSRRRDARRERRRDAVSDDATRDVAESTTGCRPPGSHKTSRLAQARRAAKLERCQVSSTMSTVSPDGSTRLRRLVIVALGGVRPTQ